MKSIVKHILILLTVGFLLTSQGFSESDIKLKKLQKWLNKYGEKYHIPNQFEKGTGKRTYKGLEIKDK